MPWPFDKGAWNFALFALFALAMWHCFPLPWWILRFLRFLTAPDRHHGPSRVADSRGRGYAGTWLDKNMLRRADERDRPTRCIQSAETEQAETWLVLMKRDHAIAVKPGMNFKGDSTSEIKKWNLTFLTLIRSWCKNYIIILCILLVSYFSNFTNLNFVFLFIKSFDNLYSVY